MFDPNKAQAPTIEICLLFNLGDPLETMGLHYIVGWISLEKCVLALALWDYVLFLLLYYVVRRSLFLILMMLSSISLDTLWWPPTLFKSEPPLFHHSLCNNFVQVTMQCLCFRDLRISNIIPTAILNCSNSIQWYNLSHDLNVGLPNPYLCSIITIMYI